MTPIFSVRNVDLKYFCLVFSAAVTAGHCICGRSLKEIEENKGDEYKCLEGESTNQITDHNIIRVTAESMEYDTDQGRSFFPESAFVKFDDTRRFEYYDVGVLKSGENFFYEANLADPMVGSICLPSTELDFSEELITTRDLRVGRQLVIMQLNQRCPGGGGP